MDFLFFNALINIDYSFLLDVLSIIISFQSFFHGYIRTSWYYFGRWEEMLNGESGNNEKSGKIIKRTSLNMWNEYKYSERTFRVSVAFQ